MISLLRVGTSLFTVNRTMSSDTLFELITFMPGFINNEINLWLAVQSLASYSLNNFRPFLSMFIML